MWDSSDWESSPTAMMYQDMYPHMYKKMTPPVHHFEADLRDHPILGFNFGRNGWENIVENMVDYGEISFSTPEFLNELDQAIQFYRYTRFEDFKMSEKSKKIRNRYQNRYMANHEAVGQTVDSLKANKYIKSPQEDLD